MKALHVIDSLGRGGAEQVLLTILPELARQGCACAVAVRRGPYDLAPELEAQGIPVHHLPETHKWNLAQQARNIARVARQMQADVVHAHLYFPAVSVAVMRHLHLHPARTFVTFHNMAYAGANKTGPGLWLKRTLARWLYPRGYDGMFGVSRAVADHYGQALGLTGIAVSHNPIALPTAIPVLPGPVSGPRLVVPGRLVPEKGHQDLIQALTRLKTPISVVFAGGGPLRETLSQAAPSVQITGTLTHEQMLGQIGLADLVVIPSRYEGFGLTALEAMALARPVIATRAGGLPEVLGDTGLLVPVGDPVQLARAIQTLLADPDHCKRLGAAGQARAFGQFSAPVIAARLLAHYHGTPKEGAA